MSEGYIVLAPIFMFTTFFSSSLISSKEWNCKICNCEINNNLIEKICINCNKPVINCSYSRNDNEIIPEHSINYFIVLCLNNGEKHYCCQSCAISDLKLFDSKIIGKIEKSD